MGILSSFLFWGVWIAYKYPLWIWDHTRQSPSPLALPFCSAPCQARQEPWGSGCAWRCSALPCVHVLTDQQQSKRWSELGISSGMRPEGRGICLEHTRTCARPITKVPTSISMLVGIMMLPGEDLVVLGQRRWSATRGSPGRAAWAAGAMRTPGRTRRRTRGAGAAGTRTGTGPRGCPASTSGTYRSCHTSLSTAE